MTTGLKIGNNFAVAEFIEEKILHEDYSPVAVCALLREEEYLEKYHITFCRATIYKYIDDGNIFPHITNKDLPEKGQRKREYKKVREKRAPRGRSIEERPPEVETREEVGHWEGDTVAGKKGSRARLLVFSERATRNEIIIKIPDGTTKSVGLPVDIQVDYFRQRLRICGLRGPRAEQPEEREKENDRLLLSPVHSLRAGDEREY